MTPEDAAALEWYGHLIISEVLTCPVCGAGVPHLSSAARQHKEWHEGTAGAGAT